MRSTTIRIDENWREQDLGTHRGEKSVCLSRYGGFGDAIQTSALAKSFKDKGHFVSLNCAEATYDVMKHDPSVDEFILQDSDQIPMKELGEFWYKLSSIYESFSVLSESVEGALLALPHRVTHAWSPKALHKYMDHNYVEFMHDIAGIDFPKLDMKFYPSKKEVKWAKKLRSKLGDSNKVIMFPLSGSSFHKVYPYTDTLIATLLDDNKDVKVILCGDEYCKILEQGWEDNDRVLCTSGEWSIRETLTFAKYCDIVIGPETGVLNAVACEDNIKIVIMSHSSVTNLTRDWTNTVSILPCKCPCYPCHKIHLNTGSCNLEEETLMPMCLFNIKPEMVYGVLQRLLDEKKD